MAKKSLMPHGLPRATPCPDLGQDQSNNTAPTGFVPEGITIQPTDDPLANLIIDIFINAEVPPVVDQTQEDKKET